MGEWNMALVIISSDDHTSVVVEVVDGTGWVYLRFLVNFAYLCAVCHRPHLLVDIQVLLSRVLYLALVCENIKQENGRCCRSLHFCHSGLHSILFRAGGRYPSRPGELPCGRRRRWRGQWWRRRAKLSRGEWETQTTLFIKPPAIYPLLV